MFRRADKENDSFSTDEAAAQGSLLSSSFSESATVVPSSERPAVTSAAPAAASSSSSNVASSYQMNASARPATPEAPASRPQPVPAGPAGAYRPAAPEASRPRPPEARTHETKSPTPHSSATPGERAKESRRILTVGADILLKGEIATCDRLVIEGKVDATLNDVGTVELAESGTFKGIATVENAEISGLFDGELVVRGRLVIYSSGKVRGKVTYGEIEIERGGELTGEIKTIASAQATRSRNDKPREDRAAA